VPPQAARVRRQYEYAAVATHRVCERSRPAILVHDHHGGAPRLEYFARGGDIVLAEETRRGALEDLEVANLVAVQLAGLEAGHGSVLVLPYEEDIEHADDPAIDQIDEHRNSFARHRSVCRIRDHHDVDGAKFVFVRFDPCLQGVGVDQVR